MTFLIDSEHGVLDPDRLQPSVPGLHEHGAGFSYGDTVYPLARRSSDGRYLIGAAGQGARASDLLLADLRAGEVLFRRPIQEVLSLAVTTRGRVLVVRADGDRGELLALDETGATCWRHELGPRPGGLTLSDDGTTVTIGEEDRLLVACGTVLGEQT